MSDEIDRVRSAIATELDGSSMVTRFVLVAETIDDDGSAAISFMSDCDLAWQTLGLLHHGLAVTKATRYEEDDDE